MRLRSSARRPTGTRCRNPRARRGESRPRRTARARRCPACGRRATWRRPAGPRSSAWAGRSRRLPSVRDESRSLRTRRCVAQCWPRTSLVDFSAVMTVEISSSPNPSTVPGRPLDPVRIGDRAAEHLIAAAQAEHMAAAPHMRLEIHVPPLRAQEGEIPDGGFRARQDDRLGIAGQGLAGAARKKAVRPAPCRADRDRRNSRCGQHRHRDRDGAGPRSACCGRDRRRPPPAAMRLAAATAPGRGTAMRSSLITSMPSSNSAGSPRNLLIRKPRMRSRSPGASTAWVPTRLAMTPPRSMSPASTTGTSAASAKPILAMSPARRFTSAGLPAPSTSTMSASAHEEIEAVDHRRQQVRLARSEIARVATFPSGGPAR